MTASDDPAALSSRQPRLHRLIRGELTAPDGRRREIVVRNLSSSGLGGASRGDPVMRGDRVAIVLPQLGNLGGVVRWSKGQSFGVEFDGTVDMDALSDALRARHAAEAPASDWEVKRMHRVTTPATDPAKLRRI